jgi:hypothetical protein
MVGHQLLKQGVFLHLILTKVLALEKLSGNL